MFSKAFHFRGNTYKYLIYFIWILSTFIITTCFSSVLLKTYFKPQTKPLVSNIDELINLKHINVWILNDSPSLEINRPREYRILKERSISCGKFVNNYPMNMMLWIHEIKETKTVMLAGSQVTYNINAMFATLNLYIPDEKIGFSFNAYLVNRKHWANNLMKKQILHFVENGVHIREEILMKLLNKYISFYYDLYYRKDYIGKSVEKDIVNQFWSPISLNELFRGLFILLLFGFVFAIFVFLFENITKYLYNNCCLLLIIYSFRNDYL